MVTGEHAGGRCSCRHYATPLLTNRPFCLTSAALPHYCNRTVGCLVALVHHHRVQAVLRWLLIQAVVCHEGPQVKLLWGADVALVLPAKAPNLRSRAGKLCSGQKDDPMSCGMAGSSRIPNGLHGIPSVGCVVMADRPRCHDGYEKYTEPLVNPMSCYYIRTTGAPGSGSGSPQSA